MNDKMEKESKTRRKKSRSFRVIIAALLVILLMGCGFFTLNDMSIKDHLYSNKNPSFWTDPSDYDVWIVGSSHVYYGIQPMELWEDLGITSYCLGNPSAHIAQTYWTIKLALKQDKPDLIVLDTYEMFTNKKHIKNEIKMHVNFDAVPISPMKLTAMKDLFNDDLKKSIKYTVPLAEYYDELPRPKAVIDEAKVESEKVRVTKGSRLVGEVADLSDVPLVSPDEPLSRDNSTSLVYFSKIIEECENQSVDLLIISIPFYGPVGKQKGTNSAQTIVDKYDADYLDLRYTGIIDPQYDCVSDNHLNYSGSQKATSYLSDYLKSNYELIDHREDKATAAAWDADYLTYHDMISEKLKAAETPESYLIWLKGGHFKAHIYASEEATNELTDKLLDNIDNKSMITAADAKEMLGEEHLNDICIIVEDALGGDIIDRCVFEDGHARHIS